MSHGATRARRKTNSNSERKKVFPARFSLVGTLGHSGPFAVSEQALSLEPRTRTIQPTGWTEPELNWTVSLVLLVLVLCVSSELNFGNPTLDSSWTIPGHSLSPSITPLISHYHFFISPPPPSHATTTALYSFCSSVTKSILGVRWVSEPLFVLSSCLSIAAEDWCTIVWPHKFYLVMGFTWSKDNSFSVICILTYFRHETYTKRTNCYTRKAHEKS